MATGVAVLITATFLFFPANRTEAQKRKATTVYKAGDEDTASRKSAAVGRANGTITVEADLDKQLAELDKAIAGMEVINWDKIGESVETAMKSVDMAQIGKTVEQAMKAVDMNKIAESVNLALQSVNLEKTLSAAEWKDVQKEMKQAMAEVKNAMKEVEKTDMKEVQQELKKAQQEIAESRIDIQQEMQKAKEEVNKAKLQIGRTKTMLSEMNKDGLLKKGEQSNINWKGDDLYINDVVQPKAVSEKYKQYRDNSDNDL